MYQLLYTTNMQPVCTGDVVHFSQRAWTVEEICNNDSYLKCWAWVRSMDEQRYVSEYQAVTSARSSHSHDNQRGAQAPHNYKR